MRESCLGGIGPSRTHAPVSAGIARSVGPSLQGPLSRGPAMQGESGPESSLIKALKAVGSGGAPVIAPLPFFVQQHAWVSSDTGPHVRQPGFPSPGTSPVDLA